MKLLVFAHVPPPHHGQSYMVQLMLRGFGGDHRRLSGTPADKSVPGAEHDIQCYHVNARFSRTLEDIGEFRGAKLFLVLMHCFQAVWCRYRYGVTNFYYIPAPGKKSALYRDWLVMLLCRPFFKHFILHWHAAGLAKWLETSVQIRVRALTYHLLKRVDLSIVLSECNRMDAEKLLPRRVRIVGNGIPDPCPDFETSVQPRHRARAAARQKLLRGQTLFATDLAEAGADAQWFQVLFLAHCTREKGLFDTLDGVALANARLARDGSPLRIRVTVAGEFMDAREHEEFNARIARADLRSPTGEACVNYLGFVAGETKRRAFADSDCFCFPTYYYAESFGLVVLEALAFGLPIVASRWRSIPEILGTDHPGLVAPRHPEQVAVALLEQLSKGAAEASRDQFVRQFTMEPYLTALARAMHSIEQPADEMSFSPQPRVS